MSTSPAAKRLKALAAEIPSDAEVRHILQRLEPEENAFADHSIALIGASVVDKALEVAIRAHLTPTKEDPEANSIFSYDYHGPLAELSARIKMAYIMKIFGPKTKQDLDHIRHVRNAFAHSLNILRFQDREVADICNSLHAATSSTVLTKPALGDSPRARYIDATVFLAEQLKRITVRTGTSMIVTRGFAIKNNPILP